eukprot:2023563-Pyramimonas_sp.AAC.1
MTKSAPNWYPCARPTGQGPLGTEEGGGRNSRLLALLVLYAAVTSGGASYFASPSWTNQTRGEGICPQ